MPQKPTRQSFPMTSRSNRGNQMKKLFFLALGFFVWQSALVAQNRMPTVTTVWSDNFARATLPQVPISTNNWTTFVNNANDCQILADSTFTAHNATNTDGTMSEMLVSTTFSNANNYAIRWVTKAKSSHAVGASPTSYKMFYRLTSTTGGGQQQGYCIEVDEFTGPANDQILINRVTGGTNTYIASWSGEINVG